MNSLVVTPHQHEQVGSHSYEHDVNLLQHTTNAALVLNHVTMADAGNYSVEVTAQDSSGQWSKMTHSAVLLVSSEQSAEVDATVVVEQQQIAVYDQDNDLHQVRLTCKSRGRAPDAVIWTDPSGSSETVNTSVNGEFSFLLSNPAKGGTYRCRIHPDSPAARCLDKGNAVLNGSAVEVDGVKARLSLLEAELNTPCSENHELKTENSDLKSHVDHLESGLESMNHTEQLLKAQIDNLTAIVQSLQQQLDQHVHSGNQVTPAGAAATTTSPSKTTTTVPAIATAAAGCSDLLTNCSTHYRIEQCCGLYESWFRAHCAESCGFCGSYGSWGVVPNRLCNDTIGHCDRLGADLCTSDQYEQYRAENCAGFCHLCDSKLVFLEEMFT
ncbi:hypothetical protein BaRGS_00011659 [Batillaria attramentaria]|uniref:ShKT domain-containing protein n=1 Tax=Batillaria attramentaria TaxID=370345 RepID=A0ABD0LC73_9CAEN